MSNSALSAAADALLPAIKKALDRDDVPVDGTVATSKVAKAVTDEVAPIIVNATNGENWTQSRIIRGLIFAVLGYIGGKIGVVFTDADVSQLIEIAAATVEAAGLVYAWYGRIVGANKKPLGV